ncbi:hypothetical protein [Methylobacterium nigriterrae]|uniref:hypothetical protein n=1 Tax=Methylobacterium nigriterrae TaxID=3127512 RepID=UPI003013BF13
MRTTPHRRGDGTILALLAIALALAAVSAAKSLFDAQTREIERSLRQLGAAP